MGYLISVFLAYMIGSSNMAFYLSRLQRIDIRTGGSGNLGTSNATIALGWRAGILTGVHDIGKALLAVVTAKLLFPELELVGAVAGVACVLGHVFPFYLKFKGGKGFAPFLGMTLALSWKLGLAMCILIVLITLITDYLVLGTFTTIVAVPLWMGFATHSVFVPLILLIATAVIFYKHRENLTRLRNGTEIGLRSAAKGDHRMN